MTSDDRQPIQDVLGGQAIHPLPDGWTPLEAFVLVKCIDKDGNASWCFRTTNRLNREELLGALTVQVESLRRNLVKEWDGD